MPSSSNRGEVIKTKRKALGLTQGDIATYCGITQPAVVEWERGKGIDADYFFKLCEVLGLTPGELLNGGASNSQFGFSDEEISLLAAFKALDSDMKSLAIKLVSTLPRRIR